MVRGHRCEANLRFAYPFFQRSCFIPRGQCDVGRLVDALLICMCVCGSSCLSNVFFSVAISTKRLLQRVFTGEVLLFEQDLGGKLLLLDSTMLPMYVGLRDACGH